MTDKLSCSRHGIERRSFAWERRSNGELYAVAVCFACEPTYGALIAELTEAQTARHASEMPQQTIMETLL